MIDGQNQNYDDIIMMEHHTSESHPKMSMLERAAQFSPFAALSGFGDIIEESRRTTENKIILDKDRKEELDRIISEILSIEQDTSVKIIHFVKDPRKEGGSYMETEGTIIKADPLTKELCLEDGTRIKIDDILDILGEE